MDARPRRLEHEVAVRVVEPQPPHLHLSAGQEHHGIERESPREEPMKLALDEGGRGGAAARGDREPGEGREGDARERQRAEHGPAGEDDEGRGEAAHG